MTRRPFDYTRKPEDVIKRLDRLYKEQGPFAHLIFRAWIGTGDEGREAIDALCDYLRSSRALTPDDRDQLALFIERTIRRKPVGHPEGRSRTRIGRSEDKVVRKLKTRIAAFLKKHGRDHMNRKKELEPLFEQVKKEVRGAARIDYERVVYLLDHTRPTKSRRSRR
jgi:hypothetical protein